MHRPLARCMGCRASILDALTSLAGISIPAQAFTPRLPRPHIYSARRFSRITPLQKSSPPPLEESTPSPPLSSIPWYLQIEEPTPPAPISPILALQEIPPLPPHPPTILGPILQHLSVQIGLDNLVLLDLRHLDPPPALGANLLMIIGTARSVKHLNVSADRLCRWVRKVYKLRPYADGLLGRNELKLKLRRKARRMKLAQSVGNTMAMKDADDGITTGWICVNMGPVDLAVLPNESAEGGAIETQASFEDVEAEEDEEEEYQNPLSEEGEYVGFGSRTNSPRIVVQMFTEEKRLEMDLEGLWDFRNTRRAKKDELANKEAEAAIVEKLQEQTGGWWEERISSIDEEGDWGSKVAEEGEGRIENEVKAEEAREGIDQSRPTA